MSDPASQSPTGSEDSTSPRDPATVFELVGESGLRKLVASFYGQIPSDDLLGPMYPRTELPEAERRLGDFLIFRFGGPENYVQERGHPRLRIRHAPFAIDQAARDRWVALMDRALAECGWPPDVIAAVKTFLHDSATFLINRA